MFVSSCNKKHLYGTENKFKLVFWPFLFYRYPKAEAYFEEMEQKGWRVYQILFNTFVLFIKCKPTYTQYYFAHYSASGGVGTFDFGLDEISKALHGNEEDYEVLHCSFYIGTKFYLYRASGRDGEAVKNIKLNRKTFSSKFYIFYAAIAVLLAIVVLFDEFVG